ncbi:hypothetical protein DVH24_041325 [Malus domestica]|uniref:GATA-type domain-containing protein n=1 Tax=Malus domestica TaxID=3750 RepID=A0A498I8T5_MALDO|nr:hypothetical protein DVH24_041325 [Malus domestica]
MSLRPSARTEVRRNRYKVAVDADEGRRRREDNMVEIRKSKREESLLKKRREGLQAQQFAPSLQPSNLEKKLESLPAMVAGVWSDDNSLQLESTTQFRKLLSIERSPPIEEVIQSGVVPRFVAFLMREDFPQLQFEAAWALTNIASGTSENTKVVIEQGAVPIFVKLLASPSDDVREQCIINNGSLPCLLSLLTHNHKKSIKKEACWTISNITAGNRDQIQNILVYYCFMHVISDEGQVWGQVEVKLEWVGGILCVWFQSGPVSIVVRDAKGSESEEMTIKTPDAASSEEGFKKTCADCGTSKTPLWRGGPAGPKSLCNACGIRSRKKRRAILGLNKENPNDKKGKKNKQLGDGLKQRLLALGREVLMQRSTVERQRRKLGEEEQAAVLLMALSYGSVYA